MGTQASFVSGALLGFVFFIAFSAYALALWYGSIRIIAGDMNGGDVVTVRFDALHTVSVIKRRIVCSNDVVSFQQAYCTMDNSSSDL